MSQLEVVICIILCLVDLIAFMLVQVNEVPKCCSCVFVIHFVSLFRWIEKEVSDEKQTVPI